jgi:hypothetical protein
MLPFCEDSQGVMLRGNTLHRSTWGTLRSDMSTKSVTVHRMPLRDSLSVLLFQLLFSLPTHSICNIYTNESFS